MLKLYKKFILLFFFIAFLILLLTQPEKTLSYAAKGLSVWYKSMVPSLLPMMILSGCMIRLNITTTFASLLFPVTNRLFHISKNGTYALFIGFLCGFPMGAKVICELYNQNKLSREEATCLLPICNNIGPIYMLSYGLKAFDAKPLYIILVLFYCIPLGYAFFHLHNKNFPSIQTSKKVPVSFITALDESISDSAAGILSLGGYLMFFNILLVPLEIFALSPKLTTFLACLVEITNGLSYPGILPPYLYLALLQFGGLCCIFQTLKYLLKTDLDFQHYLFCKLKLTGFTLVSFFAYYVFAFFVFDV